MPKNQTASEEIVIIIRREGKPHAMVLKNGETEYFIVKKMKYSDHVELHGADRVQE